MLVSVRSFVHDFVCLVLVLAFVLFALLLSVCLSVFLSVCLSVCLPFVLSYAAIVILLHTYRVKRTGYPTEATAAHTVSVTVATNGQ